MRPRTSNPDRLSRRLVLTALMLSLFLQGIVGSAAGTARARVPSAPDEQDGYTGRVLVRFAPGMSASAVARAAVAAKGRLGSSVSPLGVRALRTADGDAAGLALRLRGRADVLYAEREAVRRISGEPNDPEYARQWAHTKIRSARAWNIGRGSTRVKLGIVDTGIDVDHPDLEANYAGGRDFVRGDSTPDDEHGHGTHVAGIAAATGNNSTGIAGAGWRSSILAAKVLGGDGSGADLDVANGIVWLADEGAAVINLSLGGPDDSRTLAEAVEYAQGKGALVVAAAGNEGHQQNRVSYPAALPGVIGVAATNTSDKRAFFSNYGSYVDITAPGEGIISTVPDGYAYLSGTSMASPLVAGATAVIKARYPSMKAAQLWSRLRVGADDIVYPCPNGAAPCSSGTRYRGRDVFTGYGRLNLYRSMNVPGTAYGVLKNAKTGAPLARARVTLAGTSKSVLTDRTGRYRMGGIPAGARRLAYAKPGFQGYTRALTMPYGAKLRFDPALKPLATLTGVARDRKGRALPGALVRVARTRRADRTDADGRYTVRNVPLGGPRMIYATKDLYVRSARSATLSMGETHRLSFTLTRMGEVAGAVTDASDGAVLAGVSVSVSGTSRTAITDSAGRYRISGVPRGTRTVTASLDGYDPASGSAEVRDERTVGRNLVLEASE